MFKISDAAAQSELLSNFHWQPSKLKPLTPISYTLPRSSFFRFYGDTGAPTKHTNPPYKSPDEIIGLFINKLSLSKVQPYPKKDLHLKVIHLRDELAKSADYSEDLNGVLEDNVDWLLGSFEYLGSVRPHPVFSKLLGVLVSLPHLGMEVFNWKRKMAEQGYPMTVEDYASGITIAGRVRNVDLAFELFVEASSKKLKTTTTYNALMTAYMYNGFADKCQSVFRNLKREPNFSPTIVTYNILMSVFGRLMLIDHMEATFQEVQRLNLAPNIYTYNNLIAAYVTAFMWDRMERTFHLMKAGPVKPNINTYLLILRGYAHSGKLDQMEETYQMVKYHVDEKEYQLIGAMICAYCSSSVKDRTKKVEELYRLIPENHYRPWLIVLLIKLYAQENNLESMESFINVAFEHNTAVLTINLMRCISKTYFRNNAVEKYANFVKRAKLAGWRICKSLYHCNMVMYGLQNRLDEMENVLIDMDNVKLDYTKKTFLILYKAYSESGCRHKVEKVVGLMYKSGHVITLDYYL